MKTYTVTMFPVQGPKRYWRCMANSLAEAAFRFHGIRDRVWMSAYVSVDGGKRSYDVDRFSRIGRVAWISPTVEVTT